MAHGYECGHLLFFFFFYICIYLEFLFISTLIFLKYVSCKLQVTSFWFRVVVFPQACHFREGFSLITFNVNTR